MDISLAGWDIGAFDAAPWAPWGSGGKARAKVLASGDGFYIAYVDAEPGYTGDEHEHKATEFSYVIEGSLRTQGTMMNAGDAYVASAGSTHSDFETETGAKYL